MNNSSDALNEFGLEVLRTLRRDKLPPLPEYYELFFDSILQTKSSDVRKAVSEQLAYSYNTDSVSQLATLESKIKEQGKAVKDTLNAISNLHKQIQKSLQQFKKHASDAEHLNNPNTAAFLASSIRNDVAQLSNFLVTQSEQFKTMYQKSVDILQQVEVDSIFDLYYGVFNKRYLYSQVSHEQQLIEHFRHKSTLIVLKPNKNIEVVNEKGQMLVNKTIAKLLMRSSRRSDIVSYIGSNTFGILLKHTDMQSSIKTCERICDMTSASNFFLGDKEIELKVCCGVGILDGIHETEEVIQDVINKMLFAEDQNKTYVCEMPKV